MKVQYKKKTGSWSWSTEWKVFLAFLEWRISFTQNGYNQIDAMMEGDDEDSGSERMKRMPLVTVNIT